MVTVCHSPPLGASWMIEDVQLFLLKAVIGTI